MSAHNTTAVGRRKTSVARVMLSPGSGKITVNKRPVDQYFPLETMRSNIVKPLEVTQNLAKFDIRVNVEGGGPSGQVGAIRLGVARALAALNEENRTPLCSAGRTSTLSWIWPGTSRSAVTSFAISSTWTWAL